MYQRFISLQWKAFYRSASFGRSMGLKIFMAFIAIYFSLVFLTLGIGLYPLLKEAFPEQEPLQIVNRFLLVYLALELLMRFMLQTLPVMTIKPLLSLPILKSKVVNYVLFRSLFSFFNFLPLLLFVPFAVFTGYKTEYSVLSITAWAVAVIGLILCINYLNFLLKKKFADGLPSSSRMRGAVAPHSTRHVFALAGFLLFLSPLSEDLDEDLEEADGERE